MRAASARRWAKGPGGRALNRSSGSSTSSRSPPPIRSGDRQTRFLAGAGAGRLGPADRRRRPDRRPAERAASLRRAERRLHAVVSAELMRRTTGSTTRASIPRPDLVRQHGRSRTGADRRVYLFDHGDVSAAPIDPAIITNGPAISPDGDTLYHVDTMGGRIVACDIESDGNLGAHRLFAAIAPKDGYLDGPVTTRRVVCGSGCSSAGGRAAIRRRASCSNSCACRSPMSPSSRLAARAANRLCNDGDQGAVGRSTWRAAHGGRPVRIRRRRAGPAGAGHRTVKATE